MNVRIQANAYCSKLTARYYGGDHPFGVIDFGTDAAIYFHDPADVGALIKAAQELERLMAAAVVAESIAAGTPVIVAGDETAYVDYPAPHGDDCDCDACVTFYAAGTPVIVAGDEPGELTGGALYDPDSDDGHTYSAASTT